MNKIEAIRKFWEYFDRADFRAAGTLMHEHAVIWEPNTREVYRNRDQFIRFNENYPGRCNTDIELLFETKEGVITSVVKVFSSNTSESHYAISFFTFAGDRIIEIIEYWSQNNEPPVWRTNLNLSERY
jgi:ketosteroid isomerase-like protein